MAIADRYANGSARQYPCERADMFGTLNDWKQVHLSRLVADQDEEGEEGQRKSGRRRSGPPPATCDVPPAKRMRRTIRRRQCQRTDPSDVPPDTCDLPAAKRRAT